MKYDTADDLYAAIGYGGISLSQITGRAAAFLHKDEAETHPHIATPRAQPSYGSDIRIAGTGDLLTQLARCCHPVPVTRSSAMSRGRGVTVHRADSHNVKNADEHERLIGAEWSRTNALFPVAIRIESLDRVGLLRDLSTIARPKSA